MLKMIFLRSEKFLPIIEEVRPPNTVEGELSPEIIPEVISLLDVGEFVKYIDGRKCVDGERVGERVNCWGERVGIVVDAMVGALEVFDGDKLGIRVGFFDGVEVDEWSIWDGINVGCSELRVISGVGR